METNLGIKMKDRVISEVLLFNDVLHIRFEDGSGLNFTDAGQSCCEHRYMSNDGDDLKEYIGARYIRHEVIDAPDAPDAEYGCHEVQFLEIMTSVGPITLSMHNEHNGYYGGFCLNVSEVPFTSND
jgi:hypothetical protein